MSISVVDLQNEAIKEEATILEPIEEAKDEEPTEPVVENEVVEYSNTEAEQPPKEEIKEEPKKPVRAQDKKVRCPKCDKEMKLKSFRYGHEQNCKGTLEQKPVKPHTNPRPKQQPKHEVLSEQRNPKAKPIPQPIYEEDDEEPQQQHPVLSAPVKNQILKPTNQITWLQSHYQLLQNEYIKQKQEKYNNLCKNMFSTKTKKR